ncbi:hypothetical protein CRV24_001971 [Beauveria bassiana]|uniref:Cerato-platanin n=1 Tax=Beauveria bassiana (strain ARSEF 2860) TaxID=655819 RepID=J4KR65_BEAB2|nr:uncharacterized protein BBA_00044 [Beauveria bassiana ARSEF 2860]EJP70414.1 hypothetical protein BBA_00044 [Beauveria bassiana ARSEF 2860]KAF1736364.1 hypothetical protein CRV24_001971 [Beauveria bassiana]KAH8717328.1 hypothetical protein HC256_002017 [Beauveria bassiana]
MPSNTASLATTALLVHAVAAAVAGTQVWATPHDSYSSSIGVLGCKINTDRVAYWPDTVTCDNICVSLSKDDRQLYLLRIDQSGGAHDISYDAWNYLVTGQSATEKPTAGGAIEMTAQAADPGQCRNLIRTEGGRLPLSAANSMNYLAACLGESGSWVGSNFELYNVLDPLCTMGHDEQCKLDWPTQNQADCPHQLGMPNALTGAPVYNIRYPSGEKVLAGAPAAPNARDEENAATTTSIARSLPVLAGGAVLLAMQ